MTMPARELRRYYDRQRDSLGEVTEMTLAGSLYPRLVAARLELYAATERCPSSLTPRQRNLIGFVTSALNGTVHCMSQVTVKLRADGLSEDEIGWLITDPAGAAGTLPPADAALVRYTIALTTRPGEIRRSRRGRAPRRRFRRPRHRGCERPLRTSQLRESRRPGSRHPYRGGPRLRRLRRHPHRLSPGASLRGAAWRWGCTTPG